MCTTIKIGGELIMFIRVEPDSLRTSLQALRTLYSSDDDVFYSVENGKMIIESVGGTHRFYIEFPIKGEKDLPMQKTTIGTLTQLLTMLGEYPDLLLTEAAITGSDTSQAISLKVTKQLKEGKNDPVDCLSLSKIMLVMNLTDSEKEKVLQSRATYTGDLLFECPAAVSVAAQKAHILKADGLYLRGKVIYCSSGDGVCRVRVPEMDENLKQKIDAEFAYNVVKLGAEKYDFYDDHVECTVGDVLFKVGIPRKAVDRDISADILDLFDTIEADDVRVYCKEVRSLHGTGPLRILPNKTMVVDSKATIGAPYILPLKDNIFELRESEYSVKQQSVTVSYTVAQAAGDEWTVGLGLHRGKAVAKVSGDCDILFNAYS